MKTLMVSIFFFANVASAKCVEPRCYVVKGKVTSCKSVKYESERVDGKLFEGVEIALSKPSVKNVACSKDETAGKRLAVIPKTIVATITEEECKKLVGKDVERFVYPPCCDTLPPQGVCLSPHPIVEDLPSHLQPKKSVHTNKQECKSNFWTPVGDIVKGAFAYDTFLKNLSSSKDSIVTINDRIKKDGILIQLGRSGSTSVQNRFDSEEGPVGQVTGLFLKTMRAPDKSDLSLDEVHEVETPTAEKSIRSWQIPFNSNGPEGIEGNELFIGEVLSSVCSDLSYGVDLAIQPDGKMRAVKSTPNDIYKTIESEDCKAAKKVFPGSDYPVCGEFTDRKTKKKRILVWQIPMT